MPQNLQQMARIEQNLCFFKYLLNMFWNYSIFLIITSPWETQQGKLDIYTFQTYVLLKRKREEEELAIILQGCEIPSQEIKKEPPPARRRSVKHHGILI